VASPIPRFSFLKTALSTPLENWPRCQEGVAGGLVSSMAPEAEKKKSFGKLGARRADPPSQSRKRNDLSCRSVSLELISCLPLDFYVDGVMLWMWHGCHHTGESP